MQVTETLNEGLKREFKVTVPLSELQQRLETRLATLKDEVSLKGFRPGKVPVNHLRRLFGRSSMAEIVQNVVNEVARNTLSERKERAATQPDFNLPEDEKEAEKLLNGQSDLSYTMTYEILPQVDLKDFKSISVERLVADVSDAEVDEELNRLADNQRTFTAKEGKSASGDRMTVSYLGKMDGTPFEGGSDENALIRLGSSQLIPGFAEQLEGLAAGDQKTIDVTFPENYAAAKLAGKPATFDITVKEVAGPDELKVDDELATRVGVESLDKLREAIRTQLQSQYTQLSRQRLKRQMLDQLDEQHKFDLPQKMVEEEFNNIWRQVSTELASTGKTFESEGTTEEEARNDYRKIAERRVRLGLVLSEIGEKNNITVTDEEAQRGLRAQLREFPGREKELLDFYRQRPEALASVRAPIFEEKVVDYLLELVKVDERKVSREDLIKEAQAAEAA